LQRGEVQRSIFYLLKGSAYQYNFKQEAYQNIIELHEENEWFLNHQSLVGQIPSDVFIAAYAPCTVLELTLEAIHQLIGCSPTFLLLNKILESSTSRVHFFDNSSTPLQKYQFVLDSRPQLLQEFPLKMIASYLKITPETLSRTREKWVRSVVS